MIFAGCYTTNSETPTTVCTRNTIERFFGKSTIIQINMQPHHHPFNWFQVSSRQHSSGNFQCINSLPCRKRKRIITQWITLIIIYNSIREINGIGSIGFQWIHEINQNSSAACLDIRLFQLRRRHHHFFWCFLQFDKLIKFNGYLLVLVVCCVWLGRTSDELGRFLIIRTSIRCSHACTGIYYDHQHQQSR